MQLVLRGSSHVVPSYRKFTITGFTITGVNCNHRLFMRVERNEKNGTLKKDGSVRWVLKQAGYSQNQMYRGNSL